MSAEHYPDLREFPYRLDAPYPLVAAVLSPAPAIFPVPAMGPFHFSSFSVMGMPRLGRASGKSIPSILNFVPQILPDWVKIACFIFLLSRETLDLECNEPPVSSLQHF